MDAPRPEAGASADLFRGPERAAGRFAALAGGYRLVMQQSSTDESTPQRTLAPACPWERSLPSTEGSPFDGISQATEAEIAAYLADLVTDPQYPCVGARSVFKRQNVKIVVLDRLGDPRSTGRLLRELEQFSQDHPRPPAEGRPDLASFVAVFREPIPESEIEFEAQLWRQLVLLHERDGTPWDETVSADPANSHFGFSVAGRAFFVIGMHSAASRIARRTPLPTLVFNLHSQFDELRATGRYDRLRDTVRKRDAALQGCVNPVLADHGERSEARQYSGRAVPDDWMPPYDLEPSSPEGDGA